jgi:hypothetical protein
MKNKRNTYVLLLLVLIIWGAVIYRFFNFTDNTEVLLEEKLAFFSTNKATIKERKPNLINTNYRDPFLGKVYLGNSFNEINRKKSEVHNKKVAPVLLPDLVYKGLVSDSKNKNKVYMVLIKGHTYLLRERETEEGITVIKGSSTEIFILYKQKKYTIGIQE